MRGVRLVALTGFDRPEDKDRILASGFDDHLLKPADVDGLRALLATLQAADPRSN
jgi:CheY-like chemotaxis protein